VFFFLDVQLTLSDLVFVRVPLPRCSTDAFTSLFPFLFFRSRARCLNAGKPRLFEVDKKKKKVLQFSTLIETNSFEIDTQAKVLGISAKAIAKAWKFFEYRKLSSCTTRFLHSGEHGFDEDIMKQLGFKKEDHVTVLVWYALLDDETKKKVNNDAARNTRRYAKDRFCELGAMCLVCPGNNGKGTPKDVRYSGLGVGTYRHLECLLPRRCELGAKCLVTPQTGGEGPAKDVRHSGLGSGTYRHVECLLPRRCELGAKCLVTPQTGGEGPAKDLLSSGLGKGTYRHVECLLPRRCELGAKCLVTPQTGGEGPAKDVRYSGLGVGTYRHLRCKQEPIHDAHHSKFGDSVDCPCGNYRKCPKTHKFNNNQCGECGSNCTRQLFEFQQLHDFKVYGIHGFRLLREKRAESISHLCFRCVQSRRDEVERRIKKITKFREVAIDEYKKNLLKLEFICENTDRKGSRTRSLKRKSP